MNASLRHRRWAVAAALTALPVALVLGLGHRGVHAVRGLLVPGGGVVETHVPLAALLFLLGVTATVAWLRWGVDWAVALVVVVSIVVSSALAGAGHRAPTNAARAAHEFPLVMLVIGFVGSLRAVAGRVPGLRWLAGRRVATEERRALAMLHPTDRCRAAAIAALAGCATDDVRAAVLAPDIVRRAHRVGLVARLRRGGDPLRVDHAHARTALMLTGALDAGALRRFVDDASRTAAGVPASEPGWVRTLDGTLAAAALDAIDGGVTAARWAEMLAGPLALRRGHRPAWWWSPLGVVAGRCLDWEHAAATAIAHSRGWIGSDDWPALRRRVLGAAARGSARRDDERLIAAGRVWLALVDDPDAERIVERPTIAHDPLAVALDQLAHHLRTTGAAPASATVPSIGGARR